MKKTKIPPDTVGLLLRLRGFDRNKGSKLELSSKVWNALLHERNDAVLQGIEGKVLAGADVLSWVNLSSALTNDDFANLNLGTVGTLDSKTFRLGIAAVTCRSLG